MRIKEIEFKNFTSYGSRLQKITLTDQGFYQVVGENGWGKSTISDVIKYVLYGTLGKDGRKLKDIPNRINGAAWGKITLETNQGKQVIVERGIDPSFINLTVDGQPYDRANKKGPSDYLADELLEIPFHIFNNIISLSVNDFKSFLNMDADSKRKIIDKLFGFAVINLMREILKEQLSQLKRILDDANIKMDSSKHSVEQSNAELEILLSKIKEKNVELIEKTQTDLAKYRKLFEVHSEKQLEFTQKERTYRKELESAISQVNTWRAEAETARRQISFYEKNDVCPTCGSHLTESHGAIDRKTNFDKVLINANLKVEEATIVCNEIRSREESIEKERMSILEKGSKIRNGIDQLTRTLKEITNIPPDEQASSIKNIISKLEENLVEATQVKSQTIERINWMKLLDDTLSDKGIKQLAIKSAVIPLNLEIAKLMGEMHMEHIMFFDEEFDAHITHLGEEISISTLSHGERKRVDFVALCALIRVMKTRYPNVNLLFLDEVLDGLDSHGVQSILKILRRTCYELQLNTFIISWNPLPREMFDYVVLVDKKNGFSSLSVESA